MATRADTAPFRVSAFPEEPLTSRISLGLLLLVLHCDTSRGAGRRALDTRYLDLPLGALLELGQTEATRVLADARASEGRSRDGLQSLATIMRAHTVHAGMERVAYRDAIPEVQTVFEQLANMVAELRANTPASIADAAREGSVISESLRLECRAPSVVVMHIMRDSLVDLVASGLWCDDIRIAARPMLRVGGRDVSADEYGADFARFRAVADDSDPPARQELQLELRSERWNGLRAARLDTVTFSLPARAIDIRVVRAITARR